MSDLASLITELTAARQHLQDWRPAGVGLDYSRPKKTIRQRLEAAEAALRTAGLDPAVVPSPAPTPRPAVVDHGGGRCTVYTWRLPWTNTARYDTRRCVFVVGLTAWEAEVSAERIGTFRTLVHRLRIRKVGTDAWGARGNGAGNAPDSFTIWEDK